MSLTTSLVSVWNLDESSGNAVDSFGSNTATQNGTIGTITGVSYPTARSLVRASSHSFSLSDNASLSMGSGVSMSIALWCRPTSVSGFRAIVSKDDYGTSNREYNISTDGNKFIFQVNGATELFANTFGAVTTNTWYFVVATFDSATKTSSISVNNGTADTSSTASGSIDIVNGTAPFRIGSLSNSGAVAAELFDGGIAQIALWKRVITGAEKTSLYNSGSGLKHPFVASANTLKSRVFNSPIARAVE